MTASSRATAADLRWRRSRPRISRLESRTALARAGTPDSADGSVHDDVDATLVAWPPLTTHLLRKQSQPDLWREKALDQPQAILRRPAPSLNENPIDLFASSRHGVARYHDDRHRPKQKAVGLPDPELTAHRPKYLAEPGTGWEPLLRFGQTTIAEKVLWGSGAFLLQRPVADLVAEFRALPVRPAVMERWLGGNAERVLARP